MAHERPKLTNLETQRSVYQPNSSQVRLGKRRSESAGSVPLCSSHLASQPNRAWSLSTESKDHSQAAATSPVQTAKPRRVLPSIPTVVKKSDSVRTSRKLPHVPSSRGMPASEHVHRKMLPPVTLKPCGKIHRPSTPSQDDSLESYSSRRSSFGGRIDHNNSAMTTDNVDVNMPTNDTKFKVIKNDDTALTSDLKIKEECYSANNNNSGLDSDQLHDATVFNKKPKCFVPKMSLTNSVSSMKMLVNRFTGTQSDSYTTAFIGACGKSYKALQKLHSKYKELIVTSGMLKSIEEIKRVLDQKDICISVFGQHNCGKSFFLNALIGDIMLPVYKLSETSVTIKVQHDDTIHQGACSEECSQATANCPQLVTGKGTIIFKQDAIQKYLKQLNKDVRDKCAEGPGTLILKVHIPLLAKNVPRGWTVSLVDNPGFGEAKEHITQIADASLVSSSAYIYLLQTENVNGKDAQEFFKELSKMDESAITDGRLTVGITKLDIIESEESSSDEPSSDDVRATVIQSTENATGLKISKNNVILVSSKWAIAGRKLANDLERNPHAKDSERDLKNIISILEANHSKFDVPVGQEESIREALLSRFDLRKLVQMVESVSGVAALKDRIDYVGSACVKAWATKLHQEFFRYLEDADTKLKSKREAVSSEKKEKEKDLRHSRKAQKAIAAKKGEIQCTIVKGKGKVHTPLWKNFVESYTLDLENSKPQESGKERVCVLITEFRNTCKEKIDGKKLGPREFEADLQEFLDVSATKLQNEFDKVCGFLNTHGLLCENSIWAVREIESLRSLTREFCHIPTHSTNAAKVDRGHREKKQGGKPLTAPNLGDIKMKVKIPKVSLPWWRKIIIFFRQLRLPISESAEDVYSGVSTSETDTLSESMACKISTTVGGNQLDTSHSGQAFLYRKWTTELEETVANVQKQMEDVCDVYFQDIQHKAIKYFYNTYCCETELLLKEYDAEFAESLSKEERRLTKLQKEIKTLTVEFVEMEEKMKELNELKDLLMESYITEYCINE